VFAKNFHCFFPNAFTTFSAPACLMSGNRTLDKHVLKSPARQDSTGDSRIQRGFLLFAGAPSAKANEKDSNRRAACSDWRLHARRPRTGGMNAITTLTNDWSARMART